MSVYIQPYEETLHNGIRKDVTIAVNRDAVQMLERELAGGVPMQGTGGDALAEMARRQYRAYSFVHDIHMQMRPQFEAKASATNSAVLRTLLKDARSYLSNPAEGHDDGLLLADLYERIDAALGDDDVALSTPVAARVIVALPCNGGDTMQFFAEPVERNGSRVKVSCSEPGWEFVTRWMIAEDLRRALDTAVASAKAWKYRDEKEGVELLTLDRLTPEKRTAWTSECPLKTVPKSLVDLARAPAEGAHQSAAMRLISAAYEGPEKMQQVAAQMVSGKESEKTATEWDSHGEPRVDGRYASRSRFIEDLDNVVTVSAVSGDQVYYSGDECGRISIHEFKQAYAPKLEADEVSTPQLAERVVPRMRG